MASETPSHRIELEPSELLCCVPLLAGNKIENLYRHVLSLAIPGGSEDVLTDLAGKMSFKRAKM